MDWPGVIRYYRRFLPVSDKTPVVTLKEGNTPLIASRHTATLIGKHFEVYFKYEGLNPTGSFKDRGMTMAVSKACENKSQAIICASTGNTSASAACYAARTGIKCFVLVPRGYIALGKLSQALIHGARVLEVEGNFDACLDIVREIAEKYPITLVNSLNPYRIEGQKTAAFEICDTLGVAPDFQVMPVGNAGNITAYWKGYKDYKRHKKISALPRMLGFQAEGAAPIVLGRVVKKPKTIATAIRIGNPASWKQAERARAESKGLISTVSDKEILLAYKLLAQREGIFVEPASAASVAGLLKLAQSGYFKKTAEEFSKRTIRIVSILTGHGLKDPDLAIEAITRPKVVKPAFKEIVRELGY